MTSVYRSHASKIFKMIGKRKRKTKQGSRNYRNCIAKLISYLDVQVFFPKEIFILPA